MKLAKTVEVAFFLIYANWYDFLRFCRKKIHIFFQRSELMDVGLSMADILNTLLDFSPRVKSLMHVRRLY